MPITANTLATISITQLTPNTAYDFYAVVEDAAGNPSVLSSKLGVMTMPPPDETAPVITGQPMLSGEAENISITVSITANEGGTIFWILYPEGNVPANDDSNVFVVQAKGETAGVKRSGVAGFPIASNTPATISITQLTPGTAYDFYAVVKDAAGNPSAISNKLSVTTVPDSAPWNMAESKWGISHHQWIPRYGILDFETWEQYTNGFDVEAYADLIEKLGAGWVLITIAQELGFINTTSDIYDQNTPPCPLSNSGCVNQPELDRADYTPTRDLILDLAKALHRKGIRTLVYLPSHTPLQWGEAPVPRSNLRYNTHYPIWRSEMIAEKSQEWGAYVSGWFFDGYWTESGSLGNEDRKTNNNFLVARRMYNAAISGNPHAVITFNPGDSQPTRTNDPFSTFTAGEYRVLPPIPSSGKIPRLRRQRTEPKFGAIARMDLPFQ